MSDLNESDMKRPLANLLWRNQLRQLTDYPQPITVNCGRITSAILSGAFRFFYGSGKLSRPRRGLWKFIVDPVAIVFFRLILTRGSIKKAPALAKVVYENILNKMQDADVTTAEITAHVRSTEKEEPLIRTCLLAMSLKMYGVAIEPLIQRLESGLPADQTRSWLAYFLHEIGDSETAEMIWAEDSGKLVSTDHLIKPSYPQPSAVDSNKSRLTYAVIIANMFDSSVFRSSLTSLVESDFPGQVVVVEEGNQLEKVCESYCRKLGVTYVKNTSWTGPDAAFNLAIQKLDPEPDIIVAAHSDVLWPPSWFGQLDQAWEKVFHFDKISMINLSYIDCNGDPSLSECFNRGRYGDLLNVMSALRDAGSPNSRYCQIQDIGRTFGLGRDLYSNDKPEKLQRMAGRYSVGASYPMQAWRDLGGFDPALGVGMDSELLYDSLQNRKWQVWTNNSPLLHMKGTDTGMLLGSSGWSRFREIVDRSRTGFGAKYGWDLDHFLTTYYGETCIIYHDEIVDGVNDLRFSDIDFVFDEFADRLARKRLDNCELRWCRARSECKYV